MPILVKSRPAERNCALASFTLVELLVVMAIIAILMALVLVAGNGVIQKALRSRASSEIQAMSTALEGYKTDNGIYPPSDGVLGTNTPYSLYDGKMINYQTNSTLLYMALSGQTNYSAGGSTGVKSYMTFKANQVGNPSATYSYIVDPFGYSYSYSTGTTGGSTNYPYNGNGFFDLWSTGGVSQAKLSTSGYAYLTNAWISNWQ